MELALQVTEILTDILNYIDSDYMDILLVSKLWYDVFKNIIDNRPIKINISNVMILNYLHTVKLESVLDSDDSEYTRVLARDYNKNLGLTLFNCKVKNTSIITLEEGLLKYKGALISWFESFPHKVYQPNEKKFNEKMNFVRSKINPNERLYLEVIHKYVEFLPKNVFNKTTKNMYDLVEKILFVKAIKDHISIDTSQFEYIETQEKTIMYI